MNNLQLRSLTLFLMVACCLLVVPNQMYAQMASQAESQAASNSKTVGFDQIKPILRKRCQSCHNPEELRGDLSVTDMTSIGAGSASGPVVVAGKPRESLLYTTTAHLDEPTMPPNSRKIPAREIELIKRWIENGLVAKSGDKPAVPAASTTAAAEEDAESSGKQHFESINGLLQATAITAIAAQPGGSLVAMSGNNQIVLLDLQLKRFVAAIPFKHQEITALTFTNDGEKLVAAGGVPGLSGSVFGFDIASGKSLFQLADEGDSILGLDISPDGQHVVLGGPSKKLKICQVKDGEVLHTLGKHTDWILCAAYSQDGLLLASADRFGGLFVWEAESGKLFQALKGHTGPVHDIAWDADGETLLSAGEDGQIRVWNLHHGELTAQWDGEVGPILTLDRSGAHTIVGGRDGQVKVWSNPETCLGNYDAKEQVDSLVGSEKANVCAATDAAGKIHLLQLPGLMPTEVLTLPTRAQARIELVSRLKRSGAEYDQQVAELRELEKSKAKQAAPATFADASQNAIAGTAKVESDVPTKVGSNTALVDAIEAEINAVQITLDAQIIARDQTQRQLANLKAFLDSQERSLESSQLQLERLQKILKLAAETAAGKNEAESD